MTICVYLRNFENMSPTLDIQKKNIEEYCKFKKYEINETYHDENINGKTVVRPKLQKLLGEIQKNDYLIFATLQILSENVRDVLSLLSDLNSKKVNIVCLQDNLDFSTPTGNIILQAYLNLHDLETGEVEVLQKLPKQVESKIRTRPRFGFVFVAKGQDLQKEPEQQRIIEKIRKLYAEEQNYSHVADILNKDGDNYYIYNNRKTSAKTVPYFRAETVKRIINENNLAPTVHTKKIIPIINPTSSATTNLPTVPIVNKTPVQMPISIPIGDCCSSDNFDED